MLDTRKKFYRRVRGGRRDLIEIRRGFRRFLLRHHPSRKASVFAKATTDKMAGLKAMARQERFKGKMYRTPLIFHLLAESRQARHNIES
jgi:hypothetical protein